MSHQAACFINTFLYDWAQILVTSFVSCGYENKIIDVCYLIAQMAPKNDWLRFLPGRIFFLA